MGETGKHPSSRRYQIDTKYMRSMKAFIMGLAFLVLIAFAAAYFLWGGVRQSPQRMNVILVSVDSLRVDHMGLYGYGRDTTPNIDAWAKQATVFDNYFSTSYLTPVSEMSVHTGRYPFTNGMINFQSISRSDTPTFAEILKKNGWQTVAFGSSPEYTAFPAIAASFSRGFDAYPQAKNGTDQYNIRSGDPFADAIAWMKSGRKNNAPFYLWLSLGSVHWPYGQGMPGQFTDPAYKGFLKEIPLPQWDVFSSIYMGKRYSADMNGKFKVAGSMAANDIAYVVDRYDDGIVRTDRMFKDFFDFLAQSGLGANTIVVLQSEHGEDLGERGYIAHYDIYDEEVHVPLIIALPGSKARRVSDLASGVDVLPTILDALGISQPNVDGKSLLPYLKGVPMHPSSSAVLVARIPLWERLIVGTSTPQLDGFLAADDANHYFDTAIRTPDWKLVHRISREAQAHWSWWGKLTGVPLLLPEYQLYDLRGDPSEQKNVYAKHGNDSAIVALQHALSVWEGNMQKAMPGPTPPQEKVQPYF